MKYYSKGFFRFLVSINIASIILTIISAFYLFILSGMGCSAGCPANYTEKVLAELLPLTMGILGFLLFSMIVLLLQQKKSGRLGYLMLALIPFAPYIVYKLLPTMWGFIVSFLGDNSFGVSAPGFLIIIVLIILLLLTSLIPFYVLIRLIKEDFFKKR
jgi:hypothetical protein